MNDQEYGELLQALRRRTLASGRSDLDGLLMNSRVADAEGTRAAVLGYLTGLRDEMSLGGESVVRESMRRLRRIPTEAGSPIEGIVVDINDEDRDAFGVDEVDLVGSPQLDQAVRQIDDLIRQLREDDAP
ncbi:hypothetical protein [Nocardioides aequoreus]|uniref:hypothetical protein n=1 Tax=Nocardioides aequoreus TaxID=397278 RepID=UPI0012F649BF|nr:hypothetical protein [Nocardioides aequoreus]